MNYLKHLFHSNKPAELVANVHYKLGDKKWESLAQHEKTTLIFKCSYCGYTWKEKASGQIVLDGQGKIV